MSEEKAKGTMVRDQEAIAMNRVVQLLEAQTPEARRRILAYVKDRYAEEVKP